MNPRIGIENSSTITLINSKKQIIDKNIKYLLQVLIFTEITYNDFDGPIPDFSDLKELDTLVLRGNSLSGSVSDIGPSLIFIDVRENSFSGTIPSSIFSHNNSTLTTVYMSNNTFSGNIPPSYAKVRTLKDLWLANNLLTGEHNLFWYRFLSSALFYTY